MTKTILRQNAQAPSIVEVNGGHLCHLARRRSPRRAQPSPSVARVLRCPPAELTSHEANVTMRSTIEAPWSFAAYCRHEKQRAKKREPAASGFFVGKNFDEPRMMVGQNWNARRVVQKSNCKHCRLTALRELADVYVHVHGHAHEHAPTERLVRSSARPIETFDTQIRHTGRSN